MEMNINSNDCFDIKENLSECLLKFKSDTIQDTLKNIKDLCDDQNKDKGTFTWNHQANEILKHVEIEKTDCCNWRIIASEDLKPDTVVYLGNPISTSRSSLATALIFVNWSDYINNLKDSFKSLIDLYPREDENKDTITKKLGLNAYGRADKRFLYIKGSFFNHSCIPNIIHEFIGDTMIFKTISFIKEGEELLTSYMNMKMDNIQLRKDILFKEY